MCKNRAGTSMVCCKRMNSITSGPEVCCCLARALQAMLSGPIFSFLYLGQFEKKATEQTCFLRRDQNHGYCTLRYDGGEDWYSIGCDRRWVHMTAIYAQMVTRHGETARVEGKFPSERQERVQLERSNSSIFFFCSLGLFFQGAAADFDRDGSTIPKYSNLQYLPRWTAPTVLRNFGRLLLLLSPTVG